MSGAVEQAQAGGAAEPELVRTRTTEIQFAADGILYITLRPGAEEKLADAQENARIAARLLAGRAAPLLIDIRAIKAQDRDARAFYNSPQALQLTSAMALLVESRVSSLIANFFISITASQGSRPMRIFTDRNEALEWLKGFLT